jgi:hypothetical protein
MSRTLHHGQTIEQKTANHEKRLLAIERGIAAGAAAAGIPGLRDALFQAAGKRRGERCRNFDPGLINSANTFTSGTRHYMAVYWPGGQCSGMTVFIATQGNYTDTAPNSGYALYTSDGTTLTQAASLSTKIQANTGERELNWSTPVTLDAQLVYVAIEYYATAATTVPQFGCLLPIDNTPWGGDTNNDWTPANWPLMFSSTGVSSPLPNTAAISGLLVGQTSQLAYVGLF